MLLSCECISSAIYSFVYSVVYSFVYSIHLVLISCQSVTSISLPSLTSAHCRFVVLLRYVDYARLVADLMSEVVDLSVAADGVRYPRVNDSVALVTVGVHTADLCGDRIRHVLIIMIILEEFRSSF